MYGKGCYSVTLIVQTLCYLEPQLSGLAGHQNIHYHTCAEGMANDLLWLWLHVEQ